MNVLIVGNGAREFSIGLAVKKSKQLNNLYFAPGNGATSTIGENIDIGDYEGLANFVKKNQIELTIVGPEAPLSSGIVDVFKKHNLKIHMLNYNYNFLIFPPSISKTISAKELISSLI